MRRNLFALAIASLVLGACVGAPRGRTSAIPVPAVHPWTPESHTAPSVAGCERAAAATQIPCYQLLLSTRLKSEGIDSAMVMLTRLALTEQVVRDNSHLFAHTLGLAAYTTPAELAQVFSRCSPGFQSGCYHGVIQAFFLGFQRSSPHAEIGAPQINSLCKDFRGRSETWLLFQCAHGLGHGLELIYSHDLPHSLSGCDLVASQWERSACYGGAFMENVVSVTNPHQMAEMMAESGGMDSTMEGMDMSGMDHSRIEAGNFKRFDPDDPHYPCSAIPRRYGVECYLMQTSLILYLNHGDFAAAAKTCEAAPADFRAHCFISLGRDANSYAGNDPATAAKSCGKAAENFRPWCHVGAARNFVDLTSHPSDGFSYCAALTENVSRVTCYSAIGEEIRVLAPDPDARRRMCAEAPAPFDAACLYGAGVIRERPAGLVVPR